MGHTATRLVSLRYVFQDVHEDTLCALLLPTNTTAAELFRSLSAYVPGKLNRSFGVGICRDGFLVPPFGSKRSLLNVSLGTVSSIEKMLASRKMSPELNNVLQDVIKMISHTQ